MARGVEGHWLEPHLCSVALGLQQVFTGFLRFSQVFSGFPRFSWIFPVFPLFWLLWVGTAASETVPEWRGKLEGESNPPSWVESWLKTTGNENRGNIWVQLLHHFRRARSSCCLWATAIVTPLPLPGWQMSPAHHRPPGIFSSCSPVPGVPRCWGSRGVWAALPRPSRL